MPEEVRKALEDAKIALRDALAKADEIQDPMTQIAILFKGVVKAGVTMMDVIPGE